MKNGVFKSDWFTGLIITFIFLLLSLNFGFIAIDDQSIDNISRIDEAEK